MDEILTFDKPTRAIVHFKEDEERFNQYGGRIVNYQVEITNDPVDYSPDKQYIRFQHGRSEIHGWVHVDSIVIDSVLESYSEETDEWLRAANG